MNKKIFTILLFTGSLCLFGQGQLNGSWYLESGYQTDKHENYFEQGLDVNFRNGNWLVGAKFEQFDPAKPQSLMNEDQGLWHKYVSYKSEKLHVRLGSFYTTFGRGLTLKAYDLQTIGLDRRIQGILVEYDQKYMKVKALGGKIYGTDRNTENPIKGVEWTFKPFSFFNFGGSQVQTEMQYSSETMWSSVFGELNFSFMNLYGEHAFDGEFSSSFMNIFGESASDREDAGTADYVAVNFFLGSISILGEWKDYEQFGKSDNVVLYNDPPTMVQEHRFILWNRHGYVLNAWDEVGFSVKLDTPVAEDGILTMQHNHTELHSDFPVFEESYAILEWEFEKLESAVIAGVQEDFSYQHKNLGFEFLFPMGNYHIGFIVEAQRRESIWVDSFDESQALTFDFTFNPNHILSLIAEHTTADDSDNQEWVGLKYGSRWGKNFECSVFLGSRRKGKICAGGVCVYTPEFEGFEVAGKYRFGS